jgi:hypothetical protein
MRNRVERFFRYLKERTVVFHHKLSARNHIQGINNLNRFLKPIHAILSGHEDREVSENAYLDTIQKLLKNPGCAFVIIQYRLATCENTNITT